MMASANVVRSDHRAGRARVNGPAAEAIPQLCRQLDEGLGDQAAAVVMYFASTVYDPDDVVRPISHHFPDAQVIGCSTAGEFTDAATGTGGISAIALPQVVVARCAAVLGELEPDVARGTTFAIRDVETQLGSRLLSLERHSHLAFVLIDGLHGSEELVTAKIREAAPELQLIGGSAGDDLAFERTWVAVGDLFSWNAVALLVTEVGVNFQAVKSCSFVASGTKLRITKAEPETRTVLQFDGKPAVQAYAAALGTSPDAVDASLFMSHPVGVMVDGEPWIRSPQSPTPEGGLKFYSEIREGTQVELMDSTDLIGDTEAAMRDAVAAVGGTASGAVMFNCILRRLEVEARGEGGLFVAAFGDVPTAGFHTYGETWRGHVNQTLTGVVFG